jgi:hypothetical protein
MILLSLKKRNNKNSMGHQTFIKKYILAIIVMFMGFFCQSSFFFDLSEFDWEVPERIPGMVDTRLDPYFVVDSAGKLHMFNSQELNNRIVIMYSKWAVGVGWSIPVDIISLEGLQQRIGGAFVDDKGMINIVFWGGDGLHADIYHSTAPISECMHAVSWSKPVLIGPNAIAPTTVNVVTNESGYIVVVYSGDGQGYGLYNVKSYDYGLTWTSTEQIYLTGSNLLWPSALQMEITEDEVIHAVWALGDTTGNSRRIFHTSLPSMIEEWREPKVLAEAIDYEADTPNIIDYNGRLVVVYHNDLPTTRFSIYSDDNGESWSSPVRISSLIGSNGPAAFVVDGNNTLHLFFGNRTEDNSKHGVWHSTWLGERWSIPKAVIAGPQIFVGPNGEEGFDPDSVQAMVCQGNVLFLAWRHDPSAGPIHLWYTYQLLDFAISPSAVSLSTTYSITPTPDTFQQQLMLEPLEGNYQGDSTKISVLTSSQLFFFSIGPAVVVIILPILFQRRKIKSQ